VLFRSARDRDASSASVVRPASAAPDARRLGQEDSLSTAAEIRHLPDVSEPRCSDSCDMVIQIWLETNEPPTGTVVLLEGETPVPFVGWLGLLRVLSELFGRNGD
jgi:hypothetical protein